MDLERPLSADGAGPGVGLARPVHYQAVSPKKLPKPTWWKNTYFWISGILFILAVIGLIAGDRSIRDPGQKREGMLWLLYLGAAVIMFVNGWLSHRQTMQHYQEHADSAENS